MIDFRNNSTKTTIISGYKPFYIQRVNSSTVVDTREEWGLVAKSNPYPALPNPKEPYSNNWLDEDGLDEYTDHIFYEPIEFSVSFYVKAFQEGNTPAANVLRGWLNDFFDFIRDGDFRTFDSYTGVGYRKVRFNGYDEDSFRARGSWAAATITVKFKANDPTTKMYLKEFNYTSIGSGLGILPANDAYTNTGSSVENKVLYGVSAGVVLFSGVRISVCFENSNSFAAPKFKIGANGEAKSIIHVPATNFIGDTTYLFEYTGTVWDCLGTI